ncbi:alpha/beta hydrolase [Sphingomonas canadensis]|uniref:Acyl-CoA:diacylglycerol acyltransferase n=1 Tax=Sphingomonas canadensis TaxID=1219257 RepID=A0ABW3HD56_9SPHN|nr:alpha/beta hydrolase-fold protein [Sphingomonas canadensis]MCW3838101.1 alpha/beta hydrolase-fold protein [Sphingomonas canadensis]
MLDRRALLRHAMIGAAAGGALAPAPSRAEGGSGDGAERLVTIPGTDSFDIAPADGGKPYRISVALPGAGPEPFGVAVLLDPHLLFGLATDLSRALAASGAIPPLILVGIGYPAQDIAEIVLRRTLDFTFEPDAPHEALIRQLMGPEREVRSGGGARFLEFIARELLPGVARRYPADIAAPMLIGHSLGGLFGLGALFSGASPFARYALSSPPVLWAQEAILRTEARHAAAHRDLPARLFLGAGGEETSLARVLGLPPEMKETERAFSAAFGDPDPVAQLRRLHRALSGRGYPGLRSSLHIFDGESHASVPAPALARALPTLFAK